MNLQFSPRALTGMPLVERPTVVVLNDFCHVQGGASKVAIDEAVGLARFGVQVIFLGAVGPVCDALRDAPLRVVCLDQSELLDVGRDPATAMRGLWNRPASRALGEILRNLPRHATIVHVHGYTKALSTAPLRRARQLGFEVVCTLHDFFAACPNGAFFDYRLGAPCGRTALSMDCITTHCDKRHYAHKAYRVARGVVQRAAGHFPRDVRHYIALSRLSKQKLLPYLSPQAELHDLANVIDATEAVPVDAGANTHPVYLGRLDVEKGVRTLADAAGRVGMAVTFVGDGPLREEIAAIEGMTVTGWQDAAGVRRYLSAARCLVFPSLWYETYGLVVGEAAAMGVPAIVSDISAAAERVRDGRTGWHFRSGDAADLARCLARTRDDAEVRAFGLAAHTEFWADPTTHERHTLDLLAIYRAALAPSGACTRN